MADKSEEHLVPASCAYCGRKAAIHHAGVWKCWHHYDQDKRPDWRDELTDARAKR